MIGGFATWRNMPIAFDQNTGSSTVQVGNYMRVSPNTSSSPLASPNIEIGLYAEKTGGSSHSYGPRWTEMTASGGHTKAITAGVNANKPDKRNHTYMTVRQEHGNQWDILYDFNKVGSTSKQPKVIGGDTNRIDVGLEVTGPKYVNVPTIANRMQFMTENHAWQQVDAPNVARSVTLPVCSTSHKPPNCFITKVADSHKFTQWTVSKPRRQPADAAAPSTTATAISGPDDAANLPELFNGVDQEALQTCMEKEPDSCLATVPGLSECVVASRLCNAAALASTAEPNPDTSSAELSAEYIRARAAAAFHVSAHDIAVDLPASLGGPASGHLAVDSTYTVTSTTSTPGLQPTDRRFEGFTASYSAHSGALLEACWGDLCDAS
ncbi:hypothetical protein ACFW1F_34150 [Streptomyces bungoensis]|uniref:hypothetical protein n=1 Tax=Streptomyces bungoensis TaxID=285568 RepID=UPI00367F53EF